ncbi:7924_t:CDS:2 [Rhizophagus irregularis]|nr:7924_t:CDS:2 [Rhizophagus irregularis]
MTALIASVKRAILVLLTVQFSPTWSQSQTKPIDFQVEPMGSLISVPLTFHWSHQLDKSSRTEPDHDLKIFKSNRVDPIGPAWAWNHYPQLNPRKQVEMSGKFWNFIPSNKLKNKFIEHAGDDRYGSGRKGIYYFNHHQSEESCIIFDDYCLKSNFSSSDENHETQTSDDSLSSSEDDEFYRNFSEWIVCD